MDSWDTVAIQEVLRLRGLRLEPGNAEWHAQLAAKKLVLLFSVQLILDRTKCVLAPQATTHTSDDAEASKEVLVEASREPACKNSA